MRAGRGSLHFTNKRPMTTAIERDPARPAHMILGPADGVDRGGRIEESIDGGHNWKVVMDGVEDPWANHMVERFSRSAMSCSRWFPMAA